MSAPLPSNPPETPQTHGKALPLVMSILTFIDVLATAAGLSDLIGLQAALVIVLVNKALQAGATVYLRQTHTPYSTVVAIDPERNGNYRAGPAALGVEEGADVALAIPRAA